MTSKSVTDLVTNYIMDGVRSGTLVPGQRLVEKELGDRIGVGRGAVREALRGLVADGFLVLERHRGVSVKSFTRGEVWAQHQVREVLEGLAASLAAEHIATSKYRAAFLENVAAMGRAVENGEREKYLELNYRFHELIVLMSGNPTLQAHIDRTRATQLRLQAAQFLNDDGLRRSHAEHQPIIDALLSASPARAERAMRDHIKGTTRTFIEMPDYMFSDPVRREST